jgi:hypothetical protein
VTSMCGLHLPLLYQVRIVSRSEDPRERQYVPSRLLGISYQVSFRETDWKGFRHFAG